MRCWMSTALVAVAMWGIAGCTRTMTTEDTRKRENSVLAFAKHATEVPQHAAQQQARATLAAIVQAAVTENSLPEITRQLTSSSIEPSSLAEQDPATVPH